MAHKHLSYWHASDKSQRDPKTRYLATEQRIKCIGVVELGPIDERRSRAPGLADQLLDYADQLMYGAKQVSAASVHVLSMKIDNGTLVALTEERAWIC